MRSPNRAFAAAVVVKIPDTRNGFELSVEEPILRAVLLRDEDGTWSLDSVNAIDGLFLSERYVFDEIVDQPLDRHERAP